MQRHSVTSLETTRSLADGYSGGGLRVNSPGIAASPISHWLWQHWRSPWAEISGGENSLHWKANMLPLFSIMTMWFHLWPYTLNWVSMIAITIHKLIFMNDHSMLISKFSQFAIKFFQVSSKSSSLLLVKNILIRLPSNFIWRIFFQEKTVAKIQMQYNIILKILSNNISSETYKNL